MPLNERDYMRSDYKYRKPGMSQTRKFTLTPKARNWIKFLCFSLVVVMVLYSLSRSTTSQISGANFSTNLNRYRIGNGYSTLSIDKDLSTVASKIAKEVDSTGSSKTKPAIIFQSDHLAKDEKLFDAIIADDKNVDALLNPKTKTFGLGICNKTVVIVLK